MILASEKTNDVTEPLGEREILIFFNLPRPAYERKQIGLHLSP